MVAPRLQDEEARLASLYSHALLDTPSESGFDVIADAARSLCGTHIGLLCLVDRDRLWFKAKAGLEGLEEVPRAGSLCEHVILNDELMVVEDAREDERFNGSDVVLGPPNIRFYAGLPLTGADGFRLGTLCVIGSQPGTLSEAQAGSLRTLRNLAVARIVQNQSNQPSRKPTSICAWCDSGQVAGAQSARSIENGLPFTHGICSACAAEFLDAPS